MPEPIHRRSLLPVPLRREPATVCGLPVADVGAESVTGDADAVTCPRCLAASEAWAAVRESLGLEGGEASAQGGGNADPLDGPPAPLSARARAILEEIGPVDEPGDAGEEEGQG